jgi:hypothetical protein
MNVTQLNSDLNAFVSKGDIISAITQFFADYSVTIDHTGVNLVSKAEHLKKMEVFLGGIAKVTASLNMEKRQAMKSVFLNTLLTLK